MRSVLPDGDTAARRPYLANYLSKAQAGNAQAGPGGTATVE